MNKYRSAELFIFMFLGYILGEVGGWPMLFVLCVFIFALSKMDIR